jgi:hypothetical protein
MLQDFAIDDHEWDSLLIPINLAFFVYDSSPTSSTWRSQAKSPGST